MTITLFLVREAFKKEIRWKLGHCPNSSGSLPSLPRLGPISENQKYFITLLCVLSHSEHVIFSVGTLMWRIRVPPLPVGKMSQLSPNFFFKLKPNQTIYGGGTDVCLSGYLRFLELFFFFKLLIVFIVGIIHEIDC